MLFFNFKMVRALNYGTTVIGHEFVHGFDNSGKINFMIEKRTEHLG